MLWNTTFTFGLCIAEVKMKGG